ncbi:bifunctional folylpolyglutamate synthase/dihydrofolate synthase [Synechococcales cyanobacterium C]|uniref:tetrahydrofolate synthase n=1 Tax=Petrachloros mirabilis ULC683 TaxID=2781853 RepID=A0A8K2ACP5_9CYAN|nr:folylpolyglutamate synthase/dihydrofolate synthase family protein [Petrachloros mirabilis]NCJ05674.1 bifunctional folylpolyglutamate synthase/dihydrofolate synthase [Petrachloros mirabilis ULC683]
MTLEQSSVADLLQHYDRFGIELGLRRIQTLLHALGAPHQRVPLIHVAGTNGKGSVCAYLSSVLTAAGFRVGRYTSPHLVHWTERICLNEQPVSEQQLLSALHQVEEAVDPNLPSPTQFEVLTAAAWLIFAQAQVDLAVIEVGLGGRLDATNVCDRTLVSVITSISRDHWQRLGDSLGAIAAEKAGILKQGCPAVIGPLPPEAAAIVQQRLVDLDCPAVWATPAQPHPAPAASPFPWAMVNDLCYPLSLEGDMQLINSAVAIAVLQQLRTQGWHISEAALVTGMAQTQWPGRLQWTEWNGFPLLVDGAHNTAAAQVLRHYVDQALGSEGSSPGGTVTWLMGLLSTKDHRGIFKALLRPGDCLVLVPVPDHSSADPNTLATLATTLCPKLATCQVLPNSQAGLVAASGHQSRVRVLCGSLYLVGAFAQHARPMADTGVSPRTSP